MRKAMIFLVVVVAMAATVFVAATQININPRHSVGEAIDAFNGVSVYYNGAIGHVSERNLAPDGYNLGLKYQCVEFVKRYYHQRFGHKMPLDRGNAKDFFDPQLDNGALNKGRGLLQFANGAGTLPQAEDLVIFAPWIFNRFGHVAIVAEVGPDYIEVIQQNPGPFGASRERYPLVLDNGKPRVEHTRLLGWLRLPEPAPGPLQPSSAPIAAGR